MDERWRDYGIALGDVPYSQITKVVAFWERPSTPKMQRVYLLRHKTNYSYVSAYYPLLF